jgi:PIN domain nuclease of toxin-antitoxin system
VKLLDTHAFIWWDGDQSKLSAAALAACQSPANSLHLSLASVWELQIKMQLGKLALHLPLADVLRDQQQQNGLVLEPVTLRDILAHFVDELDTKIADIRLPHRYQVTDTLKASPMRLGDDEAVERVAVKCGKRRKGKTELRRFATLHPAA